MKNIQSILALISMTVTSLMAIVLTFSVLAAWTPTTAQAHPSRTLRGIVDALPDDARDEFTDKMKQDREIWYKDVSAVHKKSKTMMKNLSWALEDDSFDAKKTDTLLKGMQDDMSRRGVKAMDRMRANFVATLGSLSPEERREFVSELREVIEDYDEDYNPRRRWWQFWR